MKFPAQMSLGKSQVQEEVLEQHYCAYSTDSQNMHYKEYFYAFFMIGILIWCRNRLTEMLPFFHNHYK